jgi:outer membrane murein-binding lipoprotein Lpp
MSRKTKALLAALVVAASVTAVAQAGQADYTPWTTAQKIDEIAGNSSELNTASQDGLPDPVSRRALALHRLEPSGRIGWARHLGRS